MVSSYGGVNIRREDERPLTLSRETDNILDLIGSPLFIYVQMQTRPQLQLPNCHVNVVRLESVEH